MSTHGQSSREVSATLGGHPDKTMEGGLPWPLGHISPSLDDTLAVGNAATACDAREHHAAARMPTQPAFDLWPRR
eukprot:6640657-Alexandrium_andersonii.AAC.1